MAIKIIMQFSIAIPKPRMDIVAWTSGTEKDSGWSKLTLQKISVWFDAEVLVIFKF